MCLILDTVWVRFLGKGCVGKLVGLDFHSVNHSAGRLCEVY